MIYNEDIVDFLKDYQRRTREVLRRTEWLAGNAALMEEGTGRLRPMWFTPFYTTTSLTDRGTTS